MIIAGRTALRRPRHRLSTDQRLVAAGSAARIRGPSPRVDPAMRRHRLPLPVSAVRRSEVRHRRRFEPHRIDGGRERTGGPRWTPHHALTSLPRISALSRWPTTVRRSWRRADRTAAGRHQDGRQMAPTAQGVVGVNPSALVPSTVDTDEVGEHVDHGAARWSRWRAHTKISFRRSECRRVTWAQMT